MLLHPMKQPSLVSCVYYHHMASHLPLVQNYMIESQPGYKYNWTKRQLFLFVFDSESRTVSQQGPLSFKHAISLVTNEPSGNMSTNLGLNPLKKQRVILSMYTVCVIQVSREEGRQMGHTVFPLWVWSWNS